MSDNPTLSQDPTQTSRARRRRTRRTLIPATDDARASFLENMARRAYPSLDFFLFSLLGGAVMGAGYLLNSPGLLIAGALLAPLMTPWVGMCLATVTGAFRYFLQTLGSLLVGGSLVLLTSFIAGFAARIWMPLPLSQTLQHTRLWWPDLVIVAFGAVMLVVSFARSETRPILPSVLLAYELYLPLSAAAFGLASGAQGLWPQGLLVLLVHLSLATLLGLVTLMILHFRSKNVTGYVLSAIIIIASLVLLVTLTGLGALIFQGAVAPTPEPSELSLASIILPTLISTTTRTATPRPSQTSKPEPSNTPAPTAIPVYAVINAQGFDSAIVRESPGFNSPIVTGLPNGSLVIVLPETETLDGNIWAHISIPQTTEVGWVLRSVLIVATPTPT